MGAVIYQFLLFSKNKEGKCLMSYVSKMDSHKEKEREKKKGFGLTQPRKGFS